MAAMLAVVAASGNAEAQLAAALAVSMADAMRDVVDPATLPQHQRALHVKQEEFRAKVGCAVTQVFGTNSVLLLSQVRPEGCAPPCVLRVHRAELFRSSFSEIMRQTPQALHGRLEIHFVNEGLAGSRVTRIFLHHLLPLCTIQVGSTMAGWRGSGFSCYRTRFWTRPWECLRQRLTSRCTSVDSRYKYPMPCSSFSLSVACWVWR
jgi:hypothetical protein